jgi:hypothetical protein
MMSKTRFLLLPLVMLVIIGLLIGGGWAIHRLGWTEGYAVGTRVAAGEMSAVPYAPSGISYLALFLTAGLAFLVLIAFIGTLLRLWAFKTVGGPWMMHHGPWKAPVGPHGEHFERHWRSFHRHAPPGWWGWEQPSDEECEAHEAKPSSAATESEERSQ